MSNVHPHADPERPTGQGRIVSVACPFELYQELVRQAQINGESVPTCATRLLSEAIQKLPPDRL